MDTNKSIKVEATKEFQVPVGKLYSAWNDPEQLKQWWRPMGNQLKEVTNNVKPGGTVRYTFIENTLTIEGKYEEVKENERLVYTWNWNFPEDEVKNGAYNLTVVFTGDGNNSSIHVTQENTQNEETLQPHQEGWEKGLAQLAEFLESSGQGEQTGQTHGEAEQAGYRESPDQLKVGGG